LKSLTLDRTNFLQNPLNNLGDETQERTEGQGTPLHYVFILYTSSKNTTKQNYFAFLMCVSFVAAWGLVG